MQGFGESGNRVAIGEVSGGNGIWEFIINVLWAEESGVMWLVVAHYYHNHFPFANN